MKFKKMYAEIGRKVIESDIKKWRREGYSIKEINNLLLEKYNFQFSKITLMRIIHNKKYGN